MTWFTLHKKRNEKDLGVTDSGEAGRREDRTYRIHSLSLLAERVCALLFTYWCLCFSFLHQWKLISGWSTPQGFSQSFPEWPLGKVGLADLYLLCSVTGIARIPGNRAECSASTQRWKEQNLPFSHHYSSSWAHHSAQHNHRKSWEVRTKREKEMIYGFDIWRWYCWSDFCIK